MRRLFFMYNNLSKLAFLSLAMVSGTTALAGFWSPALSQSDPDPCGCNVALRKDVYRAARTQTQQEAYLHSIDEKTWSAWKSKGAFGVSIPIVDVPVNLSGTFEDFDKRRTEYFEKHASASSATDAWEVITTATRDIAYDAWSQCKADCTRSHSPGFTGWKKQENRDSVKFILFFAGPANSPPVAISGTVENGTVDGVPSGKAIKDGEKIESNGYYTVTVKRGDRDKEILLEAKADGYEPVHLNSRWSDIGNVKVTETTKLVVKKDKGSHVQSFSSKGTNVPYINTWTLIAPANRQFRDVDAPSFVDISKSTIKLYKKLPLSNSKKLIESARKKAKSSGVLLGKTISADQQQAVISFQTNGVASNWKVTAPTYQRIVTFPTKVTSKDFLLGKTITVEVSANAKAAILEFQLGGNKASVAAGQSLGAIQCINTVNAGLGGKSYTYVVKGVTKNAAGDQADLVPSIELDDDL